jgi:divalent metal cation (Fe/Co/Zn/Cd) transporter
MVDPRCSVIAAHDVVVGAEHALIHAIPGLAAVIVHADPPDGADHHALLAGQVLAPSR